MAAVSEVSGATRDAVQTSGSKLEYKRVPQLALTSVPFSFFSMFHALHVLTTGLLLSHAAIDLAVAVFNPGDYETTVVTCPATDRVLNQTVDITIGEYICAPDIGISSRRVH